MPESSHLDAAKTRSHVGSVSAKLRRRRLGERPSGKAKTERCNGRMGRADRPQEVRCLPRSGSGRAQVFVQPVQAGRFQPDGGQLSCSDPDGATAPVTVHAVKEACEPGGPSGCARPPGTARPAASAVMAITAAAAVARPASIGRHRALAGPPAACRDPGSPDRRTQEPAPGCPPEPGEDLGPPAVAPHLGCATSWGRSHTAKEEIPPRASRRNGATQSPETVATRSSVRAARRPSTSGSA